MNIENEYTWEEPPVTLSILIPTLKCRRESFGRVITALWNQMGPRDDVELLPHSDDGELTTGEKRNELLKQATGRYTVFCDDDDELSGDYLERILEATKSDPDVITYDMERLVDGEFVGKQVMRLSHRERFYDESRRLYLYPPSHLCPMKREIALKVPFPEQNTGEDTAWVDEILPHLKTEAHVDAVLYRYLYRTDKRGEQSNANRNSASYEVEREIDTAFWWMMAFHK